MWVLSVFSFISRAARFRWLSSERGEHTCNVWVCWVLGAFIKQSRCVYVFGLCGIAVYELADYGIAVSVQVTLYSAVNPSVWDWGFSRGRLSK